MRLLWVFAGKRLASVLLNSYTIPMLLMHLFKNTTAQIVAKGITAGGTLILTIFIAKTLGQEQYGAFTKIVTLMSLFYLFVDFGGNPFFLQEKEQRLEQLLLLRLIIAALMLGIGISIVVSPLRDVLQLSEDAVIGMWILLISLFPQALFYTTQVVMQKQGVYERSTMAQAIGTGSMLFCASIAFFLHASLPYFIGAVLVGTTSTAIVSLLLLGVPLRIESFHGQWMRQFILHALPFSGMLFFNLIYFRIDIVLLSYFTSSSDVGIYGFAYRFFDFLIAIPLFLSNALYPLLLVRDAAGKQIFDRKHLSLFFGISLVLSLVGWIGAPLLSFIDGHFAEAVLPFRILVVSLPLFFLTSYLQWVLITKRQQVVLAGIYFACGIGTILLNLAIIPYWGYNGAAVVTGISEGIVLLLLWLRYATLKHT